MVTSGELQSVSYKANALFEEAAARAGIAPNVITGEMVVRFLRQLNLVIKDFVNWGIQLWAREQILLPTYEGVARIACPIGTSLILTANRRTFMRPSGINTSSAGGTVLYAFDDDFSTILTQISTNGNVQTAFDSNTIVNGVGLLWGFTGTFNGVIEVSADGSTWDTVYTYDAVTATDKQWLWIDLDYAVPVAYIRIRASGGSTIVVREIYWGNMPQEIPLGVYGLDEYNWLPNKSFLGQVTQFYQQRSVPNVYIYVWPLSSAQNKYDHLVCWRQRYAYDVTALNQDIEVPERWREALTAIMAYKACRSFKEADKTLIKDLAADMSSEFDLARGEERDLGFMNIMTDVSAYTRGG